MEVITAIIGSLVAEVARCTISPIKDPIKYLSNLGKNVQSLKEEVNKMYNKRVSIQHFVDVAELKGDNIESDVVKWLTGVNKKISEVEKVIQCYEQQENNKCFVGLCPNLKARYKFSRKVEEEAKVVAELLENGNFHRISYPAALQDIIKFSNKDFKEFESRTGVLNGIMDAVKDDSIRMIGVHGMGGVGKTTLVKEVARQVKERKLFDSVVLATVTQTFDVKNIQNQIAESLGLKFDEQSIDWRACRLRERLKKEKMLVVFDDIWERLDLGEVGIPLWDAQGGLKILLTSRDHNVLSNGMDSQNNFGIDLLTEEEAWDFFQKMAGDCVQSDDLQHTAIEIAKKCARLPIAIATVARALKNKKSFEWRNALRELERPSPTRFPGVYSAIELSYKYLQSEEDRMTFLLCSLLGHNGSIEDLLRYTMGLGLYDGVNKIDEARDKVLSVVNTLKASCLLLDSFFDELFDIHDVVLDVALSIAFRDRGMFAQKKGGVLKELPSKEIMKDCKMIVLRQLDIKIELSDELELPYLSLFYIHNGGTLKIPDGFFKQTERLKVLDLTRMHLTNLPISISILRNLRTLCLDRCTLEDITVVGELNNLEILSLQYSYIKALPKEMAHLTRLKLLDLSNCTKLEIIPPNILSSLSELEELYMEDSFARWEDGVASNERRNASLEELNHLSNLSALFVVIPDDQIIPEWLLIKNLDRYRISNRYNRVGIFGRFKYSRILTLQLNTNAYPSWGIKMLVTKAEYLCLEQLKGVKNVIAELQTGRDFPHLKKLHIESGSKVQFITAEGIGFSQLQSMTLKNLPQLIGFCSEGNTSQLGEGTSSEAIPFFNKQTTFPRLEELELCDINIRRIWHSQFPETSYCISNLTRLIIDRCDNLEHLLSPSVASCLVQLKDFEISGCKCLREIISKQEMEIEEDEQKVVICFPQLASLKIEDLHNLIEFCSKNYIIEFPLLKELKIKHCPILQEFISSDPNMPALFNQKVAIPNLEELMLSELRIVKIFQNELLEGSFCKLEEMTVTNCNELLTVFPSNISFEVFQNLKQLWVEHCNSLEVIFDVGKERHVVESKLRDLYIQNARGLKQIWNRDLQGNLSFQSLSEVKVWRCDSLKDVFPASIAKNLPQLKNLLMDDCGVEEIVWEGLNFEEQRLPLPLTFKFPRLSSLQLLHLKKLKCFYGVRGEYAILLEWPMLKSLETDYSTLLKIEALQHHQMNKEAQSEPHLFSFLQQVFPKLEELKLSDIKDVESGRFPISLLQRFHSLESLQLSYCDFNSFPISLLQRFHRLKSLKLSDCDFKDVDVVLVDAVSTITKLKLEDCQNLKQLGLNFGFSSSCFQNLTTLKVYSCEMMINLVTLSVAQNLVQLTTLQIRNCIAMTEIVAKEGADEDGSTSIIFSKLRSLHLVDLKSLTSFCFGNYTFKFPSLEELIVGGCPSFKLFCHGILSTPYLHRVRESKYDHDDEGHWTGDLNTTLQQMYAEKVGYGEIWELKLSDKFPELMEIWNGRNPQQYLDLKWTFYIELCECSNLKYCFTSSMALSLNMLFILKIKECISMEQVIWDECHEMEETKYNDGMFSTLEILEIESCANFQSFYFGSGVLRFSKLEKIRIFDCPKMMRFSSSEKKINDTNGECSDGSGTEKQGHLNIEPFFNQEVDLPNLKELKINGIRNCRKIWQEQLFENSFCELKNIEIESCGMLLNIFPFNMMERLARLEKLQIVNCDSVEEIFELEALVATKSIVTETVTKFMFPKVTYFRFDKLPNLKSFYSKKHATEWPSLKKIEVVKCPKVEVFASEYHSFGETLGESQSETSNIQLTLFWVNQVTFPILEELILKQNDTMKGKWLEQVHRTECFRKLKVVELSCIPDELTAVSYCFIKSLRDLEKLTLNKVSFCQVFQYDEVHDDERHASVLSGLIELRLSKLPELTHLWKEQFQPTSILCNLNILEVVECGKLMNLVPCWISFKNLITLKVSGCDGLISLIACSAAKSLMHLTEMSVSDCKMIEAIIECECDDKEGGIIFSQLKLLELSNLPNLSSFCLGEHSFEFPALTKVIVRECPTMENFCQGDLKTSYLRKVWLTADEGRWEDDLKTTIKTLFKETNVQIYEVTETTV